MRRSPSRTPLVLAFFIALSGACGGDDDGVPVEYETKPGPSVPQPPAQRRLSAEGEATITTLTGDVTSATLFDKVEGNTVYSGRESGFTLEMQCGDTIADVDVALYFSHRTEILRIERKSNRWSVNGRAADVVPSKPASTDAGGASDADADADVDAGVDADVGAGDASVTVPPSPPEFTNGVGLPAVDHSREVLVTLIANEIRYDVRATIPWRASIAPATCQEQKPGTGTKGSSGGCGGSGGSSSGSRRSSGGDWD